MPPAPLPRNEAERLAELYSYGVLDTVVEPAMDAIVGKAASLLSVPIAVLSLIDRHRQWVKASVGMTLREFPRELSFCTYTLADARPLLVEDATADARFADNPVVVGPPDIRFYLGAPLVTPRGHVIGSLCVLDREPRSASSAQVTGLVALARQAMSGIEVQRTLAGQRWAGGPAARSDPPFVPERRNAGPRLP